MITTKMLYDAITDVRSRTSPDLTPVVTNLNFDTIVTLLNEMEKEHARVVRDQKGCEVTFTCTVITSNKHGLQGHHQVKAKSRNGGGSAIRATYAEAEAVALARLNYEIEYGQGT